MWRTNVISVAILAAMVAVDSGAFAQPGPPPPPDGGEAAQGDRDRGGRGFGGRNDRGDRGGRGGRWGNPAQGILGGPMGRVSQTLFQPEYLTRDAMVIGEIITLDDEQRDIIEMLLEDYDETFQMAAEETRAAMTDLGEASGVADLEAERVDELRGRMDTMRAEMREAREAARAERKQAESAGETDGQPEANGQARSARNNSIRSEFRERMGEIRNEFREIRRSQLQSDEMQNLMDAQMDILRRFSRARVSMGSEVSAAMQSVLTEEQLADWPEVDRRLRRLRELPQGRLQGERTDLWPVVDATLPQVDEDQAVSIREVMQSWELDLDDAIRHRAEYDKTAMIASLEAMQASDFDMLIRLLKQRQVRHEAVRDVTDLTIDSISVQLEGEVGSDFRRRALAAGYDRIYRSSRAQRVIEAALKLEDLDEETLAAVAALLEECTLAMDEMNEDILNIVRLHEEPREMRFVRRMQERESGEVNGSEEEQDPIRLAFDERGELENAYLERLKDLLGEEVFAELPGANRRDRGRRGGWGGGGPGGGDSDARRADFMQRFDENGDGEIDDAEREKIRSFFQQVREEGGFGGARGGPGGGRGR